MSDLPYIYRWTAPAGRKGQRCAVLARSRRGSAPPLDARAAALFIGATPTPKNFNSVLLQFADGFRVATSGHAIRKATA